MVQVTVNVHAGPGESDHARPEFVLQVFQVGHQQGLGVGADLVHDSVILSQHKLQLIVVHLELVFLEEYDLGAFRDVDSDSAQALGFSDQGEDFAIEVHVKLVVIWMSDD